jgi:uncharacterized protein (TIGR00255 family)
MIRSMTGFGRSEQTFGERTFQVEVKALNGKQLDVQLKMSPLLRPFEFEIRNLIQEHLLRGSVECIITIKQNGTAKPVAINTELIRAYYGQISGLSKELNMDMQAVLSSLLRLPEVVAPTTEVLNNKDFEEFKAVLLIALGELDKHRKNEGESIMKDLKLRMQLIKEQEGAILQLDPRRKERIREEIHQLLANHVGAENVDGNRLEQELIYYMEKIDINEEQIRLRQHCEYFDTVLESAEMSKGKKLGFILQEVGREINTTGSKAYDADIQKSVVIMKDELEKAKEQVLNIL